MRGAARGVVLATWQEHTPEHTWPVVRFRRGRVESLVGKQITPRTWCVLKPKPMAGSSGSRIAETSSGCGRNSVLSAVLPISRVHYTYLTGRLSTRALLVYEPARYMQAG